MITSRDNPKVKVAIKLRESARARKEQGLFFLEGFRLCSDAMASGHEPQTLFATQEALEKYSLHPASCILITESVAQKLGDTKTPQGMFGVWKQEAKNKRQDFWRPGGRYIALEHVQDPGNFGGAARTAEALGISGLLISGGCDIYHPKALRASMGALLRLPVLEVENLAEELAACNLPCYAAVPDGAAIPVNKIEFSNGAVVLIGNEGGGLSLEAIKACEVAITIPMNGRMKSLNAAAAATILMWEMVK